MTPVAHILSVTAIWTTMLFGLRFMVDAVQWLRPMRLAAWRLARCRGPSHAVCIAAFFEEVDQLHVDLRKAMTTPWSATLLFGGCSLVGLGFVFSCLGDTFQLVTRDIAGWRTFDVVTDCIGALCAVAGMSFVQAATARRRTVSFVVSAALVVTGLGIGIVTL